MPTTIPTRTVAAFAIAMLAAVAATVVVTTAWRVDAAPGPGDSTFVPIEPCRLFDFRPGSDNVGERSGALGADETATVQVTGTSGNCIIPDNASGVSMNVTAVGATVQTNVRIFPAGSDVPLASNLNPSPGDGPAPNKVDVGLGDDGSIGVYNSRGEVFLFADVVGYYVETHEAISTFKVEEDVTVDEGEQVVNSVILNAPADGVIVANAAARIGAPTGFGAFCRITINSQGRAFTQWESPGAVGSPATISNTFGAAVPAGVSTIEHRCIGTGSNSNAATMRDPSLTATWTPQP